MSNHQGISPITLVKVDDPKIVKKFRCISDAMAFLGKSRAEYYSKLRFGVPVKGYTILEDGQVLGMVADLGGFSKTFMKQQRAATAQLQYGTQNADSTNSNSNLKVDVTGTRASASDSRSMLEVSNTEPNVDTTVATTTIGGTSKNNDGNAPTQPSSTSAPSVRRLLHKGISPLTICRLKDRSQIKKFKCISEAMEFLGRSRADFYNKFRFGHPIDGWVISNTLNTDITAAATMIQTKSNVGIASTSTDLDSVVIPLEDKDCESKTSDAPVSLSTTRLQPTRSVNNFSNAIDTHDPIVHRQFYTPPKPKSNSFNSPGKMPWTAAEDALLVRLIAENGRLRLMDITDLFNEATDGVHRTRIALRSRWIKKLKSRNPHVELGAGFHTSSDNKKKWVSPQSKSSLSKPSSSVTPSQGSGRRSTRPKPPQYVYNGESWDLDQDSLLARVIHKRGKDLNWQKVTDIYNIISTKLFVKRSRTLVAVYSRWRKRIRHDVPYFLAHAEKFNNNPLADENSITTSAPSSPKCEREESSTTTSASSSKPGGVKGKRKLNVDDIAANPKKKVSSVKRARKSRLTAYQDGGRVISKSNIGAIQMIVDWCVCESCGEVVQGTSMLECAACTARKFSNQIIRHNLSEATLSSTTLAPLPPPTVTSSSSSTSPSTSVVAVSALLSLGSVSIMRGLQGSDSDCGADLQFVEDITIVENREQHDNDILRAEANQQSMMDQTSLGGVTTIPSPSSSSSSSSSRTAIATDIFCSTQESHEKLSRPRTKKLKRVKGVGVPYHLAMSVKFARAVVDGSIAESYVDRHGNTQGVVALHKRIKTGTIDREGHVHRRSLFNDQCARCGSYKVQTPTAPSAKNTAAVSAKKN